jgi:hypothetical protein
VLTQDFAFSLGRFFLHLVSVFPSSYRWAIVSAANSTPSERFGLLFSVQFLSRLSPEYSKINFSNILPAQIKEAQYMHSKVYNITSLAHTTDCFHLRFVRTLKWRGSPLQKNPRTTTARPA